MSQAFLILLMSAVMGAIGITLWITNQPTEYERQTRYMLDPALLPGLVSMRWWRRSRQILGGGLTVLGGILFCFSFILLARQ